MSGALRKPVISQPCQGKRRQGPLRPEHLLEIERAWRALDPAGRLSLTIERTNKTIRIDETRVTSSDILKSSYTGAEQGV